MTLTEKNTCVYVWCNYYIQLHGESGELFCHFLYSVSKSPGQDKVESKQEVYKGLKPHITEVDLCIKSEDRLWDAMGKVGLDTVRKVN